MSKVGGARREARQRAISFAAFALGAVLFAATLYYLDFHLLLAAGRRLGVAMLLAIVVSGLWHLTRTWAWAWCFPSPRPVSFLRLTRVRLAAEAFSYLTLRGIAGEPLKVVLLAEQVDPRVATAAVALERIAYMAGTTLIVGIGSVIAIATLPMTATWFRVFRAFAIAAGVVMLLAGMVLTGRGTYFISAAAAFDRAAGTSLGRGRVGRFVGAVERQLLDLVRGNGARLAVLTIATICAYTTMSLEAWIIMRAAGVPLSWTSALAVETFSRVASFGSAFIPANLGALEASSVAAVAAVGASAAGAPLALARRVRGLFWAGVGLAIYPRRPRSGVGDRVSGVGDRGSDVGDGVSGVSRNPTPVLLYLPSSPRTRVSPFARVAGLPVAERVLRSAFRAGYQRVVVFADASLAAGLRAIAREIHGNVTITTSHQGWIEALSSIPGHAPVTAIGAGTVVSPALLEDAAGMMPLPVPRQPRDVPAGSEWPVSGLLRVRAGDAMDAAALGRELDDRLTAGLPLPSGEDVSHHRGRLVLRLVEPEDAARAEQTIRRSIYKATDDAPARFNRRISLPISIALIRTPITPNQLSVALVALGFYSGWLFGLGQYSAGVLAAFLSLAASVLDGSDGEIARLKYQESRLGCWIDTFGDYSYYVAIFIGLTVGATRQTGWAIFYWLGGIALFGTLLSFALLIYLRSRITGGRPERLHAIAGERFTAHPSWWSRLIWRLSVVATRCAMPYGIFALSLLNLLPLVVVLAAIGSNTYWISLVLKLRHLLGEHESQTVAA